MAATIIVVALLALRRKPRALTTAAQGMPQAFLDDITNVTGNPRHILRKPVMNIGRSDGQDIVVLAEKDPDKCVSDYHAAIQYRTSDENFYIVDQYSTNGVYVDGHRIQPGLPGKMIKSGNWISLVGPQRFDFILNVPEQGAAGATIIVPMAPGQAMEEKTREYTHSQN